MLKNLHRTLGILIMVCLPASTLLAQCLVAPPAPSCTGTETLATDGETLTLGSKWFYGSATTFDNYTMNGGTLIVCGKLTIDKFTFNTGTLYVLPGAIFTIGSGIGTALQLQGGCYVYNYGTIISQRTIALDNAHVSALTPNVFINASDSSMLDVPYNWFVINNPYSWLVINGKANFHGIITDQLSSAGSVCMGNKSQTYQTVLINNAKNTYSIPSGAACLSVNEHSYLCSSVTPNSGLNACLSSTHITDSSCLISKGLANAWGSAQQMKNCATCAGLSLLPLRYMPPVQRSNMFTPFAWPNPFTSRFFISLPAADRNADITITDAYGGNIQSRYTGRNTNTIEILLDDRDRPGIYFVRIHTAKEMFVQKLVKQ